MVVVSVEVAESVAAGAAASGATGVAAGAAAVGAVVVSAGAAGSAKAGAAVRARAETAAIRERLKRRI